MEANADRTIKLPKRQGQETPRIAPDWLLFAIVQVTVSVIICVMESCGGPGSLLRTHICPDFTVDGENTGKFCDLGKIIEL